MTPGDYKKFGIDWSLRLTNEDGFIVALVAGLLIANFFPRFADWLREAARPELYIKVAIVVLGAFLATTFAGKLNFASTIVLRGIAAIVEAYLIYWAVVYYVARRYFRFNREFAVPLASGISICGVAAAIATGSAIRARPEVPILVSSLVVVFAVVEVLLLPFLAQTFLWHEPLVAAAWMGLAVKTDGAAVAAGGITDALVLAKNAANGVVYQKDSLLATTTAIKIFIDVFIGVWAFILAFIWTRYINVDASDRARPIEIWQRFPKFIVGFALAFALVLAVALLAAKPTATALAGTVKTANTLRVIFFILTFFSIGLLSDFKRLWQAGIGKLAAVCVVSLVRLRDLGGLAHLVAVFCRREAAAWPFDAGRRGRTRIERRPKARDRDGALRAAAAGREKARRLEPWDRRRAARCAHDRQQALSGGELTGAAPPYRFPGPQHQWIAFPVLHRRSALLLQPPKARVP